MFFTFFFFYLSGTKSLFFVVGCHSILMLATTQGTFKV
jgi:hypothetical protein